MDFGKLVYFSTRTKYGSSNLRSAKHNGPYWAFKRNYKVLVWCGPSTGCRGVCSVVLALRREPFASSFALCTATYIDVRAIPLSVWHRIAGERR